ncbi:MAG TPA: hypothetical protein VMJ70_00945 [Candidatus Sulfotelmatobacter sp.]|nr:hypothetical protein [Candidatus Sulfotelmatobacter sp.]
MLRILPARIPDDLPEVKALFLEYVRSLDVDLSVQGFDREVEWLPGDYAPPRGALLHMRLDTLPTMTAAFALYRRLGFREIPPYRHNPIEGTRFLECRFASAARALPGDITPMEKP